MMMMMITMMIPWGWGWVAASSLELEEFTSLHFLTKNLNHQHHHHHYFYPHHPHHHHHHHHLTNPRHCYHCHHYMIYGWPLRWLCSWYKLSLSTWTDIFVITISFFPNKVKEFAEKSWWEKLRPQWWGLHCPGWFQWFSCIWLQFLVFLRFSTSHHRHWSLGHCSCISSKSSHPKLTTSTFNTRISWVFETHNIQI